ncbi:diphthine methyltransferase [Phoenix dactylifera]|uniref:methylated diphthine methylhydrolase n=1 Tax=Phoenix dactylifera TaxID=42345 RepID=A0A8B7D3E1_PHODC|nr:diphthine methyltransferase [Phoenix dactylifera]XP_008812177.1 diphthine methyltransferase [Phoenix dactylifera]
MDVDSCYLDGNADAVEFCPHHPFHHILAAATYTLEEGNQPHRSGSISLFSADADVGLELLHRVRTTGIFDIKWNPSGDGRRPLLAQADADGCVSLLSLQSKSGAEDHGTVLREVCSEKISSAMCLCVDWNTSAGSISLGLSDGSASIVTVRESQLQLSQSWAAHEYELWATTFDTCRPHLLFTGSDDCRFSCWDLRESPSNLVFQNAKSHKMGVCCIAQNPMNSNMLLTGSYDESIRLWDIRSTSKPVNEKSLCLGGGVWRIKHHPYISNLVLAACMHNGSAIVRIEEADAIVVEAYREHESLAYGADWQRGVRLEDGSNKGSLVATCSFYDRLLRLWKPESVMVK